MPDHNLGTCCGCRVAGEQVRNIFMLDKKCPVPGHGWGCVQCGLPSDGCCVVLCDACYFRVEMEGLDAVCVDACRGYPATDGRMPYADLVGHHDHDLSKHPEVRKR